MDISEGWGMVAAAWVAAIAAGYSARITYKAAQDQVKHQGLYEHRLWKRQARMEAYQKFMSATDKMLGELEERQRIPTVGDSGVVRALDGLLSAQAGVRLVGPHDAFLRAKDVTDAVLGARRALARPLARVVPVAPQAWAGLVGKIKHEQAQFVVFAAGVLDDPEW